MITWSIVNVHASPKAYAQHQYAQNRNANTNSNSYVPNRKMITQKEAVEQSCKDRNPRYFPNINHFKEMCSAIKLVDAAPYPPQGWVRDTISWRVKLNQNVSGFKELKENDGVYYSYKIFPFIKYTNDFENKKLYIYGTVTPWHIERLNKKFFNYYKVRGLKNGPDMIGRDISYRIGKPKPSVFNMQKKYTIVNVSFSDKAYFVIYAEAMEAEEIKRFISQINYNMVRTIHQIAVANPVVVDEKKVQKKMKNLIKKNMRLIM